MALPSTQVTQPAPAPAAAAHALALAVPKRAPAPAISYTPTDVVIPAHLHDKVPDLQLYKQLQDAERQIDLLLTKKGLDFQAIHARSMQPSNFKNDTGVLRVFVYNTCENQPWQKQLLQEQGNTPDPAAEALWTLRVEGRYVSDSAPAKTHDLRFSSFLSGISVDLVANDDYPALQANASNVIEWRDESQGAPGPGGQFNPARPAGFDGLDVKRPGIFNLGAKIALMVKDPTPRLRLSDPMAHFVGKKEATQQELIYLVWQYVLHKNLFKKADSFAKVPAVSASSLAVGNSVSITGTKDEADLTVIESDDVLRPLLRVDSFKFADLYKLLQQHFKPREPIVIDYEINTRVSSTLGQVVLDIPVELPVAVTELQREVVESNKRTFENLTKSDAVIQLLNQRISLGIVSLQNANARETFYRELSADPVTFIEKWLQSQAETLKALKSEEGYDEEEVRRAEYFEKNETLLRQKIDLLLGSLRY